MTPFFLLPNSPTLPSHPLLFHTPNPHHLPPKIPIPTTSSTSSFPSNSPISSFLHRPFLSSNPFPIPQTNRRKPPWKIMASSSISTPANHLPQNTTTPINKFHFNSFPSNSPTFPFLHRPISSPDPDATPQTNRRKSPWKIMAFSLISNPANHIPQNTITPIKKFHFNSFPSNSPTFPFPHKPFSSSDLDTTPQTNRRKEAWRVMLSTNPADAEVEMVKSRDGVWTAKQKKVVLLWDLDNKPPRGPPYQAAMALRELAQLFGDVVDMSAYANRHAFIHLPQWVVEERRERRQADILERKGHLVPSEPYVCGVCGRKCRTNLDLKKHFKQLHEREREKKLSRMRSLKGKKRQRYKERFVSGNHKYEEAARQLIRPRIGYGLASELRRAGVFVKTVEDKPQAADWALKRQMQHSMSRGIDWLFLVSDDSDFSEMLRRARESNMRTVVIGDGQRALGRNADIWVPWIQVENGEVDEELLRSSRGIDQFHRYSEDEEVEEEGFFSLSHLDEDHEEESDMDSVVDDIVVTGSGFNRISISAFSEEDFYWDMEEDEREGYY